MVAAAPIQKSWYDIIVTQFEAVGICCEQAEARGWEVTNVFNTGVTMKSSAIELAGPAATSPLIAVVCRKDKTGEDRETVFQKEPLKGGNIIGGKFSKN